MKATGVQSLRIMTYNVHSFVGTDGVYDAERTAEVIARAQADVVALQEVDTGPSSKPPAWRTLAERLGMTCHFTLTRASGDGHFGNALLSRYAFEVMAEGQLPRKRDEARGVQWFKLSAGQTQVHLMNTHLSVRATERTHQMKALLGAEWLARAGTDLPIVVCGDLNSPPLSWVYRRLSAHLRDAQRACPQGRRATWPSRFPFLRIDHLFVSREVKVQSCGVPKDALTRGASDHLPLIADLQFHTSPRPAPGPSL